MKLWVEPDQMGAFIGGLFGALLADRCQRMREQMPGEDRLAVDTAVRELISVFPEPLAEQLRTQVDDIVKDVLAGMNAKTFTL